MARGTQFGVLVAMLRDELGRSESVAVGKADRPRLMNAINRAYENIADDYTWPHLRTAFAEIPLSAGQRFYSLPAHLDFDKIEESRIWFNSLPQPLGKGISTDDYLIYNSQTNQRSDPVLKYDIRWSGTVEQLEFWPMPASNGQTAQFIGQTKITRLVADADVCLLDDWLVVLKAKASLIKDADERKLALAELKDRADLLKANAMADEDRVQIGLGGDRRRRDYRPEGVTILVRG